MRTALKLGFALLLLVAETGVAAAQARASELEKDPYFGVKLMLGVAGSASVDDVQASVGGLGTVSGGASGSTDLEPTFGVGAEYMHPLHKYFVLGGLFAFATWQSKAGDDAGASRSLLFDLSVVPEGRLPISNAIELYLALPIGVSLDDWKGGGGSAMVAGNTVSVRSSDTAVGFNLSVLFGARFGLSRGFGLFAETGYTMHSFSHDISGSVFGVTGDVSAHLMLEQLALNVGVFF